MAIYSYKMEPLTDFTDKENIKHYKDGLKTVAGYLGREYPLVIDGERVKSDKTVDSMNPADHTESIGTVHLAGVEEVKKAFASALDAFETWKNIPARVRADILFKAAAIIRKRKFEFSALMTKEAGKPYIEADADTAEAIDFLEYYGRQILEMQEATKKIKSRRHIEKNDYRYIPLGVGVVITPWNFPLAILTGMTSAAVVSGNTILLKPAETTQVIAHKMLEVLEEAGLPRGVINLVPGHGEEIGDFMVEHPKTRFVSFTGSREVGIRIYEKAAKVQKDQIWLKRVVAEMGGKNAIIVDKDFDPEEAAEIIKTSAFGFSGQKCSACSRAIIHEDVYDRLLEGLEEKTLKLKVGNPEDEKMDLGPVNDENAFNKISEYLNIAREEGNLLVGGNVDAKQGWFVEPTIFTDVKPHARIMQEEIFGPVLAVTKVKDFTEALDVANFSEYGLTGAVLSKDRANLEKAKEMFHVGNLYLNRKCTGAIVGYQPFGGFNMSGTDSKAGGPEYLLHFMQAKTITEQL